MVAHPGNTRARRAPRHVTGAGVADSACRPLLSRIVSALGGSWASRPHALTRSTAGRLNAPRPALVEAGVDGTPCIVNRQQVAFVREEWRVVDRWWTEEPSTAATTRSCSSRGRTCASTATGSVAAGSRSERDAASRAGTAEALQARRSLGLRLPLRRSPSASGGTP